MERREFINKTCAFTALSLLPEVILSNDHSMFKMGYQLYSIRDEMAKNPVSTLVALKEMGYQNFESYGYEPELDSLYGFKSQELKKILDDLNLSLSSGHFGFSNYTDKSKDSFLRFVDQCIVGANHLGMKYITWPWINEADRTIDGFKKVSELLNLAGDRIVQSGLGFAYHNHGYEFQALGKKNGYQIILEETDPNYVKLQMDMYWVVHSADFTPKELVDNQAGRIVMWHIKDMDKNTRDYTELGNGSIDYSKIMPDPKRSGLEFYFIEQGGNYSSSSMKSARTSAAFLKKNLQHLL